ncbi:DUF3078 domain-containing protein [Mangrovimonas sp. AS39]|uniref:DUF3078 domain-containing protein n=1 Tax=Mangrovimonas futianensis TaxID=2895523 RepID=UPI001E2EC751|nr:DUF3078 domain-containing protein [Mangrovimonas futianensis]MCF1191493.1 DUF3078 domain-containing protein [Mangrovimonas futianensis]MCF1195188.1 DUF3078 domain-containing protein [Mangrovimonas futianensis]
MQKFVKGLIILLVVLCSKNMVGQPDSLFFEKEKLKTEEPLWTLKNKAGVDITQVAFVNWNAGGTNSISGLLGFESSLKYETKNLTWVNVATARYGVNKQEEQTLRKTDDLMDITSNLGYRRDTLSNWYFSARFNFKSQFSNGYNYPDTENAISRFMAPGYLFLGGGMEYGKNIEKFSMYFSPLTLKSTFVLDERLANLGSFGVDPAVYDEEGNLIRRGQKVRRELGILFTSAYESQIFYNIYLKNGISLYTDYINNFGNVDVDWQVSLDCKVNNYVRATLASHLKYDDDIKILEEAEDGDLVEKGARIQWKQILGLGVVVDF